MDNELLIKAIVQCIYNVHGILSPGFLESVYKRALLYELQAYGLDAVAEKEIVVTYKGQQVGYFRADIVVENSVIIELKAVERLSPLHEVQLVNYLTATGIDNGILVNFGEEFAVRRKFRIYSPRKK